MAAPVSTVPAVKAYLFSSLLARPELQPPVLVTYDEPGSNVAEVDRVWVGNVARQVRPVQMVGSGGAGWLFEDYTLEVVAQSVTGLDAAQAVFERCAALADVAVDVVRSDPSLGGRVIQAWPQDVTYDTAFDDDYLGRMTTAVVTLHVEARI